jgi:hypothetical protein
MLSLPLLLLMQFVHMMVDSDPGANCKSGYQGKRLSLDLAAADEQANKAAAPATAGAAAAAAAAPAAAVAAQ